MASLTNLEGTNQKETECLCISKASEIDVILNNNYAATAAGNNGAINIWLDLEDKIHCESMKYCISQDKKVFTTRGEAKSWVKLWLKKIN